MFYYHFIILLFYSIKWQKEESWRKKKRERGQERESGRAGEREAENEITSIDIYFRMFAAHAGPGLLHFSILHWLTEECVRVCVCEWCGLARCHLNFCACENKVTRFKSVYSNFIYDFASARDRAREKFN